MANRYYAGMKVKTKYGIGIIRGARVDLFNGSLQIFVEINVTEDMTEEMKKCSKVYSRHGETKLLWAFDAKDLEEVK